MSVQEMKPVKEGKVREIYDNGDSLIMVATDRISCFDVILRSDEEGNRPDPDVQILVRYDGGYPAEPYAFRGCAGYAGVFPAG